MPLPSDAGFRVMRGLPTEADILAAALGRLSAWPAGSVETALDRVAELIADGVPIDPDWPEVEALLDDLRDGRDPWPAFCALVVLHAHAADNAGLLFRAGGPVLHARQQVLMACGERGGDALTELIEQYVAEGIAPAAMWADICRQAEDGFHDVLAQYDEDTKILTYVARSDSEERLVDIKFPAFRRRVQRIARRLRHQPANVAPHPLRYRHG
jgi:hypothetical protein